MVTLKAKSPAYKTIQGDMWDMIAIRQYGDEHAMHHVQDANFDERFVDGFFGGVILDTPSPVMLELNLKARRPAPNLKQLLPWLS